LLAEEFVRAMMIIRANGLLKETSGVRPVLPETLVAMLNAGIHPVVPEQGSVGASGDLAPLSHMALAMMGEGDVFVTTDGVVSRRPARDALPAAGIEPVVYEAKEGLALINGTPAHAGILALLAHDANRLWFNTHGAVALSLEGLKGSPDAYDERLHDARPHPGQLESARLLRELLTGSELRESHRNDDPRVQDAYCLRCVPQVMGAVKDSIDFAARVAKIEINSATDNPLVLDDDIVSGGNFHGQPVAQALDFLAVSLTTLLGMSERRIERIVNPDLSGGLSAFLAINPGLESGFMMVQIGAAALVGESRSLATPASVQSVPTDANQEDFVPMGMAAAFKARRIYDNARRVVACELLSAAEALERHRPLRSSERVEQLLSCVRERVAPLTGDRPLTDDIENLADLVKEETLI
ncbi:MAG: histidine ammonia-lyase, partial [Gemmatimonadota bacterium]|nr:histidine ammonia-lyase [Gemmatimonadota bacterium]